MPYFVLGNLQLYLLWLKMMSKFYTLKGNDIKVFIFLFISPLYLHLSKTVVNGIKILSTKYNHIDNPYNVEN